MLISGVAELRRHSDRSGVVLNQLHWIEELWIRFLVLLSLLCLVA